MILKISFYPRGNFKDGPLSFLVIVHFFALTANLHMSCESLQRSIPQHSTVLCLDPIKNGAETLLEMREKYNQIPIFSSRDDCGCCLSSLLQ